MQFLTDWVGGRICKDNQPGSPGAEALEKYRIEKLNGVLREAQYKSRFYQEKLLGVDRCEIGVAANIDETELADKIFQIETLDEFSELPFTTGEELVNFGYKMLCIKPEESSRITTGKSKGRKGQIRNVAFSFHDQREISEYIKGMLKDYVHADDVALILLPCRRPGSIGDIYREALEHLAVHCVPYGPLDDDRLDWSVYLDLLKLENVSVIIGEPSQIANLAELAKARAEDRRFADELSEINGRIRLLFLQHENFSKREIESEFPVWNCDVIRNYGNLESGYRIAAHFDSSETKAHLYEICDSDIYLEIVNAETGLPLGEGERGEIVITTLTRGCMPLIRYKTGDKGMIIRKSDDRVYLSC